MVKKRPGEPDRKDVQQASHRCPIGWTCEAVLLQNIETRIFFPTNYHNSSVRYLLTSPLFKLFLPLALTRIRFVPLSLSRHACHSFSHTQDRT